MDISISKSGGNGHQKYNVSIEGRLSMKEYRIKNKVRNNPPSSYTTNNENEKSCIQIINEILKRSSKDNKLLSRMSLLTALNEFHIRKCVCSTIKPKLLPYPELYDVTSCSEFVANFFNYEPLKDPFQPPIHLVSPTQTIEWGIGDCFDLATVLASFLIAAGYDAYIVYGIAPKWICQRNKRRSPTYSNYDKSSLENFIDSDYQNAYSEEPKETSQNIINPTHTYGDQIESHAINNDDDDGKTNGLIHCWVLVKPGLRNDIDSTVFVEPSTGQIYPCKLNCPYTEVFAVWNTKNYWVHLSSKNLSGNLSFFDSLQEKDQWLPVFHNTPSRFYQENTTSLLNIQNTAVKPFDPPTSWVQNLHIDPHLYEYRYPPNGQRVSYYKTSKVELFSKKKDRQGVLRRTTNYKDQAHIHVGECCENFGDDERIDCLIKRIKRPMEMYYHEYFSKKHGHALSEYIEVIGVKREMKFRAKSRKDGLKSREEIFQQRIIERYTGRPDRLSKRSIFLAILDESGIIGRDSEPVLKLTSIENSDTMIVKQIVDEFKILDEKLPLQVAKRVYSLECHKIECSYRCYEEGYVSTLLTMLNKNDKSVKSDNINEQVEESIESILNLEKKIILAVRQLHQQSIECKTSRNQDEKIILGSLNDKEISHNIFLRKPINLGKEKKVHFLPNQSDITEKK